MKKRYLIFKIDSNYNSCSLLAITYDYYYARRLYKRYKEMYSFVYVKSIYDNELFEISTEERF